MTVGAGGQSLLFFDTTITQNGFGFIRYGRQLFGEHFSPQIQRIFALARHLGCDILAQEEIALPEEAVHEQELLSQLKGSGIEIKALQLTFFKFLSNEAKASVTLPTNNKPASKEQAKEQNDAQVVFSALAKEKQLQCLGFATVYFYYRQKLLVGTNVRRSVLRPSSDVYPHHYVHSKAHFNTIVNEFPFGVAGSFFAEQQGFLSCCAHAAIISSLENIFTALGEDSDWTFEKINETLCIDHRSRYAYKGLTMEEIRYIFHEARIPAEVIGGIPFTHSRGPDTPIAAAYQCVESGFPAILCFEGIGADHAMAVVGHTFDPLLWSARAEDAYFRGRDESYLASLAWVDRLIVHDDNFGPYCTLLRSALWERRPRVIVPSFSWSYKENPYVIERYAADFLVNRFLQGEKETLFHSILESKTCGTQDTNFFFFELMRHVANHTHILRTTPSTRNEYKLFLDSILDRDSTELSNALGMLGDEPFWLVEISIPDLFQCNSARLGEIIIKESAKDADEPWIALVRLPGVLSLIDDPNNIRHIPIGANFHYPIVIRNEEGFRVALTAENVLVDTGLKGFGKGLIE